MNDVIHKPVEICMFKGIDLHHGAKISIILLDTKDKPIKIKIQSSKTRLKSDLKNLRDGKKNRIYFAYGMTDIDIYKAIKDGYDILNSPHDGLYYYYRISENDLDKLINEL